MNLEHLNAYPAEKVRALLGVTVAALSVLMAKWLPELLLRRQVERVQRPDRQRAVGGGRHRRLKPSQEVLLTLIYLRHNVATAVVFFFSSRRRHTRCLSDWSSDVCSSD